MAYDKKLRVATHSGEHGDHPVGGALGAAVGAATAAAAVGAAQGAALGTAAGLPGMAVGVAVGSVIGALAGKGAAQELNPTTGDIAAEDLYWQENYKTRYYVTKDASYDIYGPAYRHGIDAYSKYEGRNFDEIEPQLSKDWEFKNTGDLALPWDAAKPAVRDAYERLASRKTNDNDKL